MKLKLTITHLSIWTNGKKGKRNQHNNKKTTFVCDKKKRE